MEIFKQADKGFDNSKGKKEKKEKAVELVEQTFGERLEQVLLESGIAKKVFAESIGIAPNTLSGYLKGAHLPDLLTFTIICRKLDVSADYMLGRTENRNVDRKHTRRESDLLSFYSMISAGRQEQLIGEARAFAKMENRMR